MIPIDLPPNTEATAIKSLAVVIVKVPSGTAIDWLAPAVTVGASPVRVSVASGTSIELLAVCEIVGANPVNVIDANGTWMLLPAGVTP